MQISDNQQFVNWVPAHMHSHGSLQDGFSKPKDIVKCCKEYGFKAAALTDHGSLNQIVPFFCECKKAGIKPLLGIEFYVADQSVKIKSPENRHLSHLVVIAKNLKGWKNLVKLVSESNKPENYYYKPRVDYELLKEYLGDDAVCVINGHPGSELGEKLFSSNEVYRTKSVEDAKKYLHVDWESRVINCIEKNIDTFGINNFFVEIQLIDQENLPMSKLAAECLREVVKKSNGRYRSTCTGDSHYTFKKDCELQRILLASNLGLTLPKIREKMRKGEDVPLGTFFISDNYHIPTFEEMQALHTEEELNNSVLLANMCEEYDILSKPKLPHFECPDGLTEIEFLAKLCEEGWNKKLKGSDKIKDTEQEKKYRARLDEELDVIDRANLSGYFLIVWDIINFCRSQNYMEPTGRGSSAGCLTSYLVGINTVDPIPYDLLFERFYDDSRAGSLPDIDIDMPSHGREKVIQYIVDKYGSDKVSQMATFGSLMGRSALKEVLRIEDAASFIEMNEITEWIPDQAQIADELEQTGEESIIRWALTNRASKLEKWCTLNPDGTLDGPLAEYFAKAIAIEGTHKSQGKHPAGVIISSEPLAECCPMVRDKEGEPVAGFEMGDLESLGLVKFDCLGVNVMDKLMDIKPYLPVGKNMEDLEDYETWRTLSNGDVKGVFQLELQKRWTKRLKPENIHHLAALVAIIRPGVVEAIEDGKSMTQHYIDRKNGEEEVPPIHPVIDPLVAGTYGVLVAQEQAMKMCKVIAGFTLKQANSLRKAAGKKDTALMAKVKVEFLEGCKKTQLVPEEISDKMFDWIQKSQRYSFNFSHSYSYAINSYYTAYCKTHAPLKFFEVYLNHSSNKPDTMEEIKELVHDARLHKIEITRPSLTNFFKDFFLDKEKNSISYGFGHIKDVGATESKKLLALHKSIGPDFANLGWIEILLKFRKINSKAMKALIASGALNGPNNTNSRNSMIYEYDSFKLLTDKEVEFIEKSYDSSKSLLFHMNLLINNHKINSNRLVNVMGIKKSLENPMYQLIDSSGWIAQTEKFYMGICLSPIQVMGGDTSIIDASCQEIIMGNVRGSATLGVTVNEVKEHTVKRGKTVGQQMAFVTGDDGTGELNNIVVFPDAFKNARTLLIPGNFVIISGKVQTKDGESSFIAEEVIQV